FPVDPGEYPRILTLPLPGLQQELGADNVDVLELQSVATGFGHLPGRRVANPEQKLERNREKEVHKRRLAVLLGRSAEIRDSIVRAVDSLNGRIEDPRSFDGLHELIKAQAYRLAQWRVAADDINYRRF